MSKKFKRHKIVNSKQLTDGRLKNRIDKYEDNITCLTEIINEIPEEYEDWKNFNYEIKYTSVFSKYAKLESEKKYYNKPLFKKKTLNELGISVKQKIDEELKNIRNERDKKLENYIWTKKFNNKFDCDALIAKFGLNKEH